MTGRLIILQEVESTQDVAGQMARRGEPEGTAVMALRQTGGRGRAGHSWISPAGKNLALSVILRPRLRPHEAPLLGLVAGIAVAEVTELRGVERALLKWPNDVLVQGKKIAGVLSEASLRGDALEFAVIGIGFNVNSDVGDFPRELQTSITSLLLSTGTKSDVSEVANDFLERFGRLYRRMTTEGCGFIRTLWESRWAHKGQTLIWEETRGTAQGIADDGSLVLATPEGQVHYISAGDVEPTGPG